MVLQTVYSIGISRYKTEKLCCRLYIHQTQADIKQEKNGAADCIIMQQTQADYKTGEKWCCRLYNYSVNPGRYKTGETWCCRLHARSAGLGRLSCPKQTKTHVGFAGNESCRTLKHSQAFSAVSLGTINCHSNWGPVPTKSASSQWGQYEMWRVCAYCIEEKTRWSSHVYMFSKSRSRKKWPLVVASLMPLIAGLDVEIIQR